MQATVREFDAGTRAGTVLLDDGTLLSYDAAAFDRGGLRLLRSGQRVRIETTGTGVDQRVTGITLPSFDLPGS